MADDGDSGEPGAPDEAKPPDDPRPRGPSPATIAAKLIDNHTFVTDASNQVYQFGGSHFEPLSDVALAQMALIEDGFRRSSSSRRREIIEQIRARTFKRDLTWGRVGDGEVALANGVVDVMTGLLRPHRAEDYLEKVIPWDYAPGAPATAWLQALATWFPAAAGGEASALQEYMGYVILSHAKFKKALILKGGNDTGKSTVLKVMRHLVGTASCCTLPVDKMEDEQACAVLIGKSLNILSELPAEALIADGGFKQLVSTEEPIFINEKYKKPFMYLPTAKHVIGTNNFPKITDRTEATLSRLLIVPMTRMLEEGERDKSLEDKLVAEMPGILLWAIEGARRLVERGGEFADVPAGRRMLEELRSEANPATDFVVECLELPPLGATTNAIPLERLVEHFNRWNKGNKKATTKGLGAMLRKAGFTVKKTHFGLRCMAALIGYRIIADAVPEAVTVPEAAIQPGDEEVIAVGASAPNPPETPRERPAAAQSGGRRATGPAEPPRSARGPGSDPPPAEDERGDAWEPDR